MLLKYDQLSEVVTNAVLEQIGQGSLNRVDVTPTEDSEGRDALRVMVVLEPEGFKRLAGAKSLDVLVSIFNALETAGEERLPIVEYARESDLNNIDDDES